MFLRRLKAQLVGLSSEMKKDLINYERLAQTFRYCPNCDPSASNPIQCLPQTCSCGHHLCVWGRTSGKILDSGQYKGSILRYSHPVALVTGNAMGAEVPTFQTLDETCPILLAEDDDIPF